MQAVECQPFIRGTRYTISPALSYQGIISVKIVEGALDGDGWAQWIINDVVSLFLSWLSGTRNLITIQLPQMNLYPGPNSVLLADNCPIHKAVELQPLFDEMGKYVLYILICYLLHFQRMYFTFPSPILTRSQSNRVGL